MTDESEVPRDDDPNWLDNLVAYVLSFIAGVLSILSLTSIHHPMSPWLVSNRRVTCGGE